MPNKNDYEVIMANAHKVEVSKIKFEKNKKKTKLSGKALGRELGRLLKERQNEIDNEEREQ